MSHCAIAGGLRTVPGKGVSPELLEDKGSHGNCPQCRVSERMSSEIGRGSSHRVEGDAGWGFSSEGWGPRAPPAPRSGA